LSFLVTPEVPRVDDEAPLANVDPDIGDVEDEEPVGADADVDEVHYADRETKTVVEIAQSAAGREAKSRRRQRRSR
jgi:hypothetical protein